MNLAKSKVVSTTKSKEDKKYKKQVYVQLVIGPPGSGKTTYCFHAAKFYRDLGRKVCVVNLDPANENMDYKADIDIMNLITVADVMEVEHLGPNGALIFCIEYLEKHYDDWLLMEMAKASSKFNYFVIDCPGQVELYTHHKPVCRIIEKLGACGYNMVAVNLIDSHYCSEPTKFISTLLLALNMMLNLAIPHVNVLSKGDLLQKYEHKLLFNIDFYTDVLDLTYLVDVIDNAPSMQRYKKLNAVICSMIEDYSLVSFKLLNSRDKRSMLGLRDLIDKASGYIFTAAEEQYINTLLANAHISSPTKAKEKDSAPVN